MKVRVREFRTVEDIVEGEFKTVHFGHMGLGAPEVLYVTMIDDYFTIFTGGPVVIEKTTSNELVLMNGDVKK